jgi:trk system potassium uptake protein TrkH
MNQRGQNLVWPDILVACVALVALALLVGEHTAFGQAHPHLFVAANFLVLATFAVDVFARFARAPDKKAHLRQKWYYLAVLVPLAQYLSHVRVVHFFVFARLVAVVMMLVSRLRRERRFLDLLSLRPARAMAAGFLVAIAVGATLLMLPPATSAGRQTRLVDAVFTATSAVCVTGLTVQDTAAHFTTFGQLVILALIQAGGLGIMTFSVSLAVFLRRGMDVRQQATLCDALDHDTLSGVRALIRFIVLMTLSVEMLGAAALFALWHNRPGGAASAAYHAVFHSISAFCNAGFSTFSDNLAGFSASLGTNAVICCLIVVGGLGFTVIRDVLLEIGEAARWKTLRGHKARVQTRTVLTVTALLIAGGAALLYAVERRGLFSGMRPGHAILASVFQSITARTAGFNTVDISLLSPAAVLVLIMLMFIGGSPGSTAGGIKTTTAGVLWAAAVASVRKRSRVEIYHRTIPPDVVQKAMAVAFFSAVAVLAVCTALLHMEKQGLGDVLFETVSAFGTVGLSRNLTPRLSDGGKLLISAMMFVGRLGPLTIAYALVGRRRAAVYEYPEERVMIG